MGGFQVLPIKPEEVAPWLLKKHYAKRMPSVVYAYGLYDAKSLVGVVTYGKPPSPYLCRGICGDDMADRVVELNRLVIDTKKRNAASLLVGGSLLSIPKTPLIVVSYADTAKGHVGYVYQATNFLYTGESIAHDSEYIVDGVTRHARWVVHQGKTAPGRWAKENGIETIKPKPRHRYVYFVGTRRQKKKMLKALRYPVLPYPKGDTKRYDDSATFPTQGILF